ncbi:MAG: excinuclease ABC subunit A, excinuclease ABC subunit A [Candidatus Peregrinibacteria bacterium GW2011_GWF2_38_29]|nr:MAG: excinuclease ABC subunit A, excinuclease ABC subunit A [Candidatus Peregrinibacteria bacterium GW2011_GWF2_38_29]HBB02314.1 excinuclease ABC subunit UvrA [Candidatus Peregrinibacteria bacterium]
MPIDKITVKGARLHNLKNISVEIPKNKLTVITGLSGSGKSTLAFDTIYAEGQRRYVESLSTYARQFLQLMEKPDVDSIDGLSPAISIDQKSAPRNPRSTVGTITEVYDYLRLIFAKVGHPHCPKCGKPITRQSVSQIVEIISDMKEDSKIMIMAPMIRDKKGAHQAVFERIKKLGFVRARVDGNAYSILEVPELDENKKHSIDIIVDRLVVKNFKPIKKVLPSGQEIDMPNPDRSRLADSVEIAIKHGEGTIIVQDFDTKKEEIYSDKYACPTCNISISEISPRMFSFNSPHGACPTCHGLGTKLEIDPDLVMPNKNLTLGEGAIMPWSSTTSHLTWYNRILEAVAKANKFSMEMPVGQLSKEAMELVLQGTGDKKYTVRIGGSISRDSDDDSDDDIAVSGFQGDYNTTFEGVIPNLERRYMETDSDYVRKKIEGFMRILECPTCHGARLKPEVLAVTIDKKSIVDVSQMSIDEALKFAGTLVLSKNEAEIAKLPLAEIKNRLQFLMNVGLPYLTLDRSANTLSGGEAQRIRLATQIGSKLSGVLYVLDEPTIGLHQDDNEKLIQTLMQLRDLDNTVIVVEHDVDMMKSADFILDIGPGAGKHGGEVVAQGTPAEIMKNAKSSTGQYLSGKKLVYEPKPKRKGNGKFIKITGAREHNLKNLTVSFPLGMFIGVTGVSGSGKSTLVNDVLVKRIMQDVYGSRTNPGKHDKIEGVENIDKVINIDQSPIGRTPRSNPATYTGVFTDIRDIFAMTPEAKLRGYKAGRFSFNVKGGRCEACAGEGTKKIEMHFLPDIYVTCEECKGQRYNSEALEIGYRGKNIAQVLDMTVDEAVEFFSAIPNIKIKLETLQDVGLGYIHLGQPATTLSGGEAQRIKLATELSRRSTGKTLYILDEPTTGLHFDDIKKLLEVLHRLTDKGNTIITIEHNLDVIKSVDHVIDLGPAGGNLGGEIIAKGTPEEIMKNKDSLTGKWLQK